VITWLIKPGELTLKRGNRKSFELLLKQNIILMLGSVKARIEIKNSRFYLHADENEKEKIEQILDRVIGISGWAPACITGKTQEAILNTCVSEAQRCKANGAKSFKIHARRTDKSFPMDSYALCCEAGAVVLQAVPGFNVDVHKPDCIISIEIREKAYIYSNSRKGYGGLPVGCAGRGLLLLSGGIDSPVAGFRLALRGMKINAVHFHSYPYTSEEARQKVIDLTGILCLYNPGIRLYILCFTDIQKKIKENSPLPWATILLRMAMMEAAERIALKTNCKCLITGDSLSQVASQTIENISCSESRTNIPVLRPLIGENKENIIRMAEKIGTYKISILPYEDCCVLFNPPHPVLHGDPIIANELYEALELEALMENALEKCECIK
jgi:thiamine biosynthesis protein ThiI